MSDEWKGRSQRCEPARVVMHLDNGYTRISLTRTEGLGMANGGMLWDIPTAAIPLHLRHIGSQFIVVRWNIERQDSPEVARRLIDEIEVREQNEAV